MEIKIYILCHRSNNCNELYKSAVIVQQTGFKDAVLKKTYMALTDFQLKSAGEAV